METKLTTKQDIEILKISGRVQMTDTDTLEENIGNCKTQTGDRLVLDLSDVNYMCSTALGVLIATKRKFMRKGAEMILVVSNGDVLDVLRLTMIDKIIHLEDTLERAMASFHKS